MYQQAIRFTLAALAAYFCTDYLAHGFYWVLGTFFPHASIPWAGRGHAVLLWVCALFAFSFWFGALPELPRISLATAATCFTIQHLADDLFWVLKGVMPEQGTAHTIILGFFILYAYAFWHRLLERTPKLPWLL